MKGKGAHIGWSSSQAEDTEERYYGIIKLDNGNGNYIAVDEYSSSMGGAWIRYVYTKNNTSFNSDKDISDTEISQQITIPAGQKQIDAYIFAIDDAVMGEEDEGLTIEIDTVINGKVVTSSVEGLVKDNDFIPVVSLSSVGSEIKEGGSEFSTVTATLSVATTQPVSVNLSGTGDNISSGDYRFSDDTLSVESGGLAAHYMFNGDARDKSGNRNHGTVDGATLTTDRFGNENSAYYFDGENDKIKVPFAESLQIEEDITLNLWVNNEETGYETDFLLRSPNGHYHIETHERDNDKGYAIYARGGGSWNSIGTSTLNNGEWNMVTFTSKVKYDENGEKLKNKYQQLRDQKIRERVEALGVEIQEGDDRETLLKKEREYNIARQKIELALESFYRSANSLVFQLNKRYITKHMSILRCIDRRFETGEIFIKWDETIDDEWLILIYIKDNSPDKGIIIEDKSNEEKNLSYEYKPSEIFKASDMMVDSLTQLIARKRSKKN